MSTNYIVKAFYPFQLAVYCKYDMKLWNYLYTQKCHVRVKSDSINWNKTKFTKLVIFKKGVSGTIYFFVS